MPFYDFECEKCEEKFDVFCSMSEKESNIKKIKCPSCNSKSVKEIVGCPSINFSNPVGTDRWHSDKSGHDYRHKYNMDRPGGVRDLRKHAESKSRVGKDPYRKIDDISSGKHFGEVK